MITYYLMKVIIYKCFPWIKILKAHLQYINFIVQIVIGGKVCFLAYLVLWYGDGGFLSDIKLLKC